MTGLYRVNQSNAGGEVATWTLAVVPNRVHRVEVSWLANVTQQVDNLNDSSLPDHAILPASRHPYCSGAPASIVPRGRPPKMWMCRCGTIWCALRPQLDRIR